MKKSRFSKNGAFLFLIFFGVVNGTAPHHRPIGQSLPPRGSLGTRQTIFASLCASTIRQGEALGQGIKKINRPAEKCRRTILLCFCMRFDAFLQRSDGFHGLLFRRGEYGQERGDCRSNRRDGKQYQCGRAAE